MLSAAESALLTQTGPGTPMGALFRRYWLPILLSEEIAERDGAPVPVEILGERLVAFRDTTGSVGLLEERCAHRCASLVYGRNEEGGLRCIFHGWKYDATGQCVDMPTELEESTARQSVRLRAYPVREAGGVVWAYLGPPDKPSAFPEFSWLRLRPEQCKAYRVLQECNYAQALERDLDPAHIPIAHRRLTDEEVRAGARLAALDRRETVPVVDVQDTAYGFRYAALRPLTPTLSPKGRGEREEDQSCEHVRMTSYVMPSCLILGPAVGTNSTATIVVPRDDASNWHFLFRYNPAEPADIAEYTASRGLDRIDPEHRKLQNLGNRHRQDRTEMRTRSFTGIDGVIIEDHALGEILGPVVDRTRERLGATDAAVVAVRRHLLASAQAVQAGADPPGSGELPFGRITGADFVKPLGIPWQEAVPLDPGLAMANGEIA